MIQILPKVTVLMPVFNCEKYLSEAIESILQQGFTDFEFLIINDGSVDLSSSIIGKYNDPRIRFVENKRNMGLVTTLNKGLELAKGQYIARMDCDDISYPERLQRQVDYMDAHPELGICGTWAELFGEEKGKVWKYPVDSDEIKASLIFESVLIHPSVIFRKSLFDKFKLNYDPLYLHAEDYELWIRCAKHFRFSNIPKILLKYRISSLSTGSSNKDTQRKTLTLIHKRNLTLLNMKFQGPELETHLNISTYNFKQDKGFVEEANNWLVKLKKANGISNKFPEPVFSQILANRLFLICNTANHLGLWAWKAFWQSPLRRYNRIPLRKKVKFLFLTVVAQWNFISSILSRFTNKRSNLRNQKLK